MMLLIQHSKEEIPNQQWSPQNSGIEIRELGLMRLKGNVNAATGYNSGQSYS